MTFTQCLRPFADTEKVYLSPCLRCFEPVTEKTLIKRVKIFSLNPFPRTYGVSQWIVEIIVKKTANEAVLNSIPNMFLPLKKETQKLIKDRLHLQFLYWKLMCFYYCSLNRSSSCYLFEQKQMCLLLNTVPLTDANNNLLTN